MYTIFFNQTGLLSPSANRIEVKYKWNKNFCYRSKKKKITDCKSRL